MGGVAIDGQRVDLAGAAIEKTAATQAAEMKRIMVIPLGVGMRPP